MQEVHRPHAGQPAEASGVRAIACASEEYGSSGEVVVVLDRAGEVELASDAALGWLEQCGVREGLRSAVLHARTKLGGSRVKTRVVGSDGALHPVTVVRLLGAKERFLASRPASEPAGHVEDPRRLLTPAQRRVSELLVTGATLAEIAAALSVSAETVKSHTKAIYARLDVSTRVELAHALRGQ